MPEHSTVLHPLTSLPHFSIFFSWRLFSSRKYTGSLQVTGTSGYTSCQELSSLGKADLMVSGHYTFSHSQNAQEDPILPPCQLKLCLCFISVASKSVMLQSGKKGLWKNNPSAFFIFSLHCYSFHHSHSVLHPASKIHMHTNEQRSTLYRWDSCYLG